MAFYLVGVAGFEPAASSSRRQHHVSLYTCVPNYGLASST